MEHLHPRTLFFFCAQKILRNNLKPNEDKSEKLPSSPISGSRLPVFGSSAGAAGATGAGAGSNCAIKIGTSAGGGGGGGGIEPVS